MKTPVYIFFLSVFVLFRTGFSQEKINLSETTWYLNENTNMSFSAYFNNESYLDYTTSKKDLDWYLVEAYYGLEYPRSLAKLNGKQLQLYFLDYGSPDNSDDYYEEEPKDTVGKALFQILTLNDSVFSIEPLDVGAVQFLDQIQQQGYATEGDRNRNEKFYAQYWKEISTAKGSKKTTVINKWKKEHHLSVDKAVFHIENWYQEDWNYANGNLIDSIYYSEIIVNSATNDSVHYIDYKFFPDGKFEMRQLHVARTANDGIPDIKLKQEKTIEFIPPVIIDDEVKPDNLSGDPVYEKERDAKSSDEDFPPPLQDEILQDGKMVYDEVNPKVVFPTNDGYYKGTFDEEWIYMLDSDFIFYGPSKQIHLGDSTTYFCEGFDIAYCGKKHLRIFYKGTYKDLWLHEYRSPILLSEFCYDFSEKEQYLMSLEPEKTKTEKFPISFFKK